METKHLTIKEAAKKTRLSQAWFRQRVYEKKIKHLRIGGRIFIPVEVVASLLKDGIVEAN